MTSIGDEAFSFCNNLKNINIVGNITSIGFRTFSYCRSLETIKVPESITNIRAGAFYGCRSLTEFEIPEGITKIEGGTFSGCECLTNIILPESVTSIGNSASSDCRGLKNLRIPESVTNIEDGAFYCCKNLTSIKIPKGVTSIASNVFSGCDSLVEIEIPKNVVSIRQGAFSASDNLKDVYYDGSKQQWEEIMIEDEKTELRRATIHCSDGDITCDHTYESEITKIPTCTEKGVRTYTCMKCGTEYTEVIAKIRHTYENGECTVCGKVETAESDGFAYDDLEDGTVKILEYYGSDTDLIIPDKLAGRAVTWIDREVFKDCVNLISVEIPESVTNIEGYAFSYCNTLESIIVHSENKQYASEDGILFNKEKTELLRCPNGKSGVIQIPDGVIKIGSIAFEGCSNLTGIEIPEGIVSIDVLAFYQCYDLDEVVIPASVTYIDESAFYDCSSLNDIIVNVSNKTYISENGILYDKEKTKVICCPEGKSGEICLPDSVVNIGKDAFILCRNLENIKMPNGVTEIEDSAFERCTGLTNIEIPDSVISIGNAAFRDCDGLVHVEIPSNVESIGYGAFSYCFKLENVTVDSANKNYISENGVLYNKEMTEILCYPDGKTDEEQLPESLTSIGEWAFGAGKITSVEIPGNVTQIGGSAFRGCGRMTDITIPESLVYIGFAAFLDCNELKNIYYAGDKEHWRMIFIHEEAFREANLSRLTIHCSDGDITCIHTYENKITTEPTCTSKGVMTYTCIKCGDQYTEVIAKLNHIYENGKCRICGNVDSSTGNQQGTTCSHTYKSTVTTQPTCTSAGVKTYTCTKCGSQYTETIAKTNHTYENGKCRLCGQADPNAQPSKTTPLAKGKTFTVSKTNCKFKVTSSSAAKPTISFTGVTKKSKKVTIPSSVTYQGVTYQVTSVSAKALKGNTKLTSLVIGSNIAKIEKNAFEGCKNLKSITVKSKKLSSVGKNALKGIHKKCKIKVPSAKLKTYKKLFKEKGQKPTVKLSK